MDSRAATLNAFITVVDNPGPGIPLAVKDLIETAGIRTTAGSAILRDYVPRRDASVVRALKAAGCVVVGKTNTHEFAYGTSNDNPHYGATRNPWNLALSTGGSSGGSAAAVAAGIVPLALGTDTAGSIRIPCALCGAVGFKPTTGLLSTRGIIPLSRTLDCVGPIAESVARARWAFGVMRGRPVATPDIRGAVIGVAERDVFDRVHPDIEALVRAALRVMESLGCVLKEVRVPPLEDCSRIGIAITRSEAAAWHRKWYPARAAEYGPDVRAKLEAGQSVSAKDYLVALEDRAVYRRAFRGVDLFAGPTVPVPAFPNSAVPMADTYRLTYPWSVAGLAAISVPCGFTGDGLPAGFQLAGRDDALVLAAGEGYELARGPWPAPDLLP